MTGIEWKGEVRSIDELAAGVESLCIPGQPIIEPKVARFDVDTTEPFAVVLS